MASHRTAAALHGFDGFRSDVVEVLVPMHVRHRRKNAIVHHTRALPPSDRTHVGVIPVTTRARTLIDLGAVSPPERVEEAFDGAERDGSVRRGQVERRYRSLRAPGRNGIGAMTQILDGRLALERIPRSVLERRMRRLLASAGLPLPVGCHRVKLADGTRYEIDFAYVEQRIAIEVDGHGSHATRRQRAADNVRASALQDAGWTLRRFTYEQVVHELRRTSWRQSARCSRDPIALMAESDVRRAASATLMTNCARRGRDAASVDGDVGELGEVLGACCPGTTDSESRRL